ncbi:MAG TPA: hypothetical protein VFW77_02550 [Candidatus Saccharimonadales bacterium]|nr:hypothetical protein [Candidatus Saccharimonadales bacterium]
MVKHIWSILCRESIVDADTNNISANQLYETLQFNVTVDKAEYEKKKKLAGQFNFEIVSLLYRDKPGKIEELDIELDILDPKDEKLGTALSKIEFKEKYKRVRNRIKFSTIALTSSGTYYFKVYIKKNNKRELVVAIPIDIQLTVNGKKV